MAKDTAKKDDGPLTRESVQQMIDAALLKRDVRQGHLHADDLPGALDAVYGVEPPKDDARETKRGSTGD